MTAVPCPPPIATTLGRRAPRGRPAAHRSTSRWKTRSRPRSPASRAAQLLGQHDRAVAPAGAAERDASGTTSPRARTPGRAWSAGRPPSPGSPGSRAVRARSRARARRGRSGGAARRPSRGWAGSGSRRRGRRRAGCRACSRTRRPRSASARAVGPAAEQLADPRPQLVRVELTGVEDDVGPGPQHLEQPPLVGDRLLDAARGQRVAPAGALEPPDEHVVGGVEEQDAAPGGGPWRSDSSTGQDVLVLLPAAPADDEGHPLGLGPRAADQLGHLGDERRRQVVDDEPAEVLEGRGRGGAAGARTSRSPPGTRSWPASLAHRRPERRGPSRAPGPAPAGPPVELREDAVGHRRRAASGSAAELVERGRPQRLHAAHLRPAGASGGSGRGPGSPSSGARPSSGCPVARGGT